MATAVIIVFLAVIGICCFMLLKIYQTNPEFIIKMLNYGLLMFLVIILSAASIALGFRTQKRGQSKFNENLNEVKRIWGGNIQQIPPVISYNTITYEEKEHWKTGKPYKVQRITKRDIKIKKSDIHVKIDKDIRKKGLHVYNGYILSFIGQYEIKNPLNSDKTIFFHLPLPSGGNNITNAKIMVNGKTYDGDQKISDGIDWNGYIKSGSTATIIISYECQGLDSFKYALDSEEREIPEFKMTVDTNYNAENINYIDNSMVHSGTAEKNGRSFLTWKALNLITRQPVAISFEFGERTDQIVSSLYFYSPIAICLFLAIMLVFSIAYDIKLHFMHFLFFGAGFLFFYFFLSYIVSYVGFIPGFIISAIISGGILLYYSKILKRGNKLIQGTFIGLVMFQLFFSFTFYFPMHTGLLILIGSAITLTLIMRATAGIDWKGRF